MPSIWSSGLVIQRDMPVTVWGWAEPGESVTVTLASNSSSVKAGEGRCMEYVSAVDESGWAVCHGLFRGKKTLEINDILVGEVWLCSGQSNMQWSIGAAQNAAVEVAAADYPRDQAVSHTSGHCRYTSKTT